MPPTDLTTVATNCSLIIAPSWVRSYLGRPQAIQADGIDPATGKAVGDMPEGLRAKMLAKLKTWAEDKLERTASANVRCKSSFAGGHGRDEHLVEVCSRRV